MSYVHWDTRARPGDKILVLITYYPDDPPHVLRAVVVERISERDALGPLGAAFRYRNYLEPAREENLHAMLEHLEGTHWIRGWTAADRAALLAGRALAALPNT